MVIPSMVVHDFHVLRAVMPVKADAPLIVDPDTELAGAIPLELFQAVPAESRQLAQTPRGVQPAQLLQGSILDVRGEGWGAVPPEDALRVRAAEAPDHTSVYRDRTLLS